MTWRPASACASVPPSTYSSSPPTGTPWAMREALMPRLAHQLTQEVRRRLAFHGRVGREDHLAQPALREQRLELRHAELGRPDAVDRRQVPHQHEIAAAITTGLLDGRHVGRRLDHAQQALHRGRRCTDHAQLAVGEHAAALALADIPCRVGQRTPTVPGALAVTLEQVEGHALRRLLPDTGQDAQRLDQAREGRRVTSRQVSQNGSFMPGGSCMPPIRPAIFCWAAPPHDAPRRCRPQR
jgi:hypothetical protein